MKLMNPFHARSPGVYPAGILSSQLPNSAYALRLTRHRHGHQSSPAFTHGGRSDAEMATPTSDDVLRPEMASATPTPDGSAMKKPNQVVRIPAVQHLDGGPAGPDLAAGSERERRAEGADEKAGEELAWRERRRRTQSRMPMTSEWRDMRMSARS